MDQILKRTLLMFVVGLWILCCLGIPSIGRTETAVAEHIEWTKTPIKLSLSVDQERQIHFPAPVRVGVPMIHRGFTADPERGRHRVFTRVSSVRYDPGDGARDRQRPHLFVRSPGCGA